MPADLPTRAHSWSKDEPISYCVAFAGGTFPVFVFLQLFIFINFVLLAGNVHITHLLDSMLWTESGNNKLSTR